MTKINLQHNEAIIMRDTRIKHDRGGMFDSEVDELVLTNLALIVAHKNIWGKVRNTQRFPLDQVRIANGAPQVIAGRSQNGEPQLHVYFQHGIEAFTLGESDDDSEAGILEQLFTSAKEKEHRNLHDWQSAISCAVLGIPQHTQTPANTPTASTSATPVEAVKSAVAAGAERVAAAVSSKTPPPPPTPAVPTHATRKCIGCTAPLSGAQGQKVTCAYCDTEQVI